MATEKEIEIATIAVVKLWQESGNPVGAVLDCRAVATAALEAAESVRDWTIDTRFDT